MYVEFMLKTLFLLTVSWKSMFFVLCFLRSPLLAFCASCVVFLAFCVSCVMCFLRPLLLAFCVSCVMCLLLNVLNAHTRKGFKSSLRKWLRKKTQKCIQNNNRNSKALNHKAQGHQTRIKWARAWYARDHSCIYTVYLYDMCIYIYIYVYIYI